MAVVAIIVTGAVLAPICADAGAGGEPPVVNSGQPVAKAVAGYSGTFSMDDFEEDEYAAIAESFYIKKTGDSLIVTGIGTSMTGDSFTVSFDGAAAVVEGGDVSKSMDCAWIFVSDPNGDYRYGADSAKIKDTEEVYSVGASNGVFWSTKGEDGITMGVVA